MATFLGGACAVQSKRVLAQNQILRVGGPIIPPYWHMQAGAPAGSLVELMRKVTSEAGFAMKADIFPSARLAYEIIQGSVDLVVTMRHSKLDEAPALLRSAEPIAALWLNLYSHRTPVVIRTKSIHASPSVGGRPVVGSIAHSRLIASPPPLPGVMPGVSASSGVA